MEILILNKDFSGELLIYQFVYQLLFVVICIILEHITY